MSSGAGLADEPDYELTNVLIRSALESRGYEVRFWRDGNGRTHSVHVRDSARGVVVSVPRNMAAGLMTWLASHD